jgi:hypothetical protein
VTLPELAQAAGIAPRYAREWLDPRVKSFVTLPTFLKGRTAVMHLSSHAHLARRAVVACATTLAVIAGSAPLAEARQSDAAKKAAEIVEFTVDVAEDLNGKFVPTLVRARGHAPGAWIVLCHAGARLPGRHH